MPHADASQRLALFALFAGAVGIGFAAIFVRLSEVGPIATAFWRVLLSWPLLLLWARALRRGRQPAPISRRSYVGLCLAGIFFAADLAVWHWSILWTSVANATLLANLAPVFVALGAWLIFGLRFRPLFLVGMAMALAGAVLLMGSSLQLGGTHLDGDVLGMITAVFYASYILTVKELRARHSTARIMTWNAAVSAMFLLPVVLIFGEALIPNTASGWLTVIGLAVISQAGGQTLIAYALAHLPAAFSSVALLFQPLIAALAAWAILGEPIGALQIAGGAIVLAGIVLARRGSQPAGRG